MPLPCVIGHTYAADRAGVGALGLGSSADKDGQRSRRLRDLSCAMEPPSVMRPPPRASEDTLVT
ncbi:MAG: hypothetical protein EXR52_01660 [Dehalococcoidia bacterium]|nr:hypothetical protein [Dehalococcoidia bacterium]